MHQHSANVPGESCLLDQVRDVIRVKHYSIRTEEAYVQWIKRFIFFNGKHHPSEMGEAEVSAFLTHLADKKVVIIFAFLDLEKNISFSDSLLARIDASGALHHIIFRGIERPQILRDDNDRNYFVERLGHVLMDTGTPYKITRLSSTQD